MPTARTHLTLLPPAVAREDAQIAQRVSTGDSSAFALLDERHRVALVRYAGSLLRRSEHDAEDVVQDVLIRAHDALRAGHVPEALRPWLYRLTRNRAIDEMRRRRWGDASLDRGRSFVDDDRHGPDFELRRKESMRRLVGDIAALPCRQREALVARELCGDSLDEVAARLDVSVAAAQKLVVRARESLVKTREARDADCDVIQAVLLDARERGVRPTEHGLRHTRGCEACEAYRARLSMRHVRQAAAVSEGPFVVASAALAAAPPAVPRRSPEQGRRRHEQLAITNRSSTPAAGPTLLAA